MSPLTTQPDTTTSSTNAGSGRPAKSRNGSPTRMASPTMKMIVVFRDLKTTLNVRNRTFDTIR
jgi:hypothetical protein